MVNKINLELDLLESNKYLSVSGYSVESRLTFEYLPAKPNWFSRFISWFNPGKKSSNLHHVIAAASTIAQSSLSNTVLDKPKATILQRNLLHLHTKASKHNSHWFVKLISLFSKKILCPEESIKILERQIHQLEQVKINYLEPTLSTQITQASAPVESQALEKKESSELPAVKVNEKLQSAEKLAKEEIEWFEQEQLLSSEPNFWGGEVDEEVLIKNAKTKFSLNNFQDAEALFDEAFSKNEDMDMLDLIFGAKIKAKLYKLREAEKLYDAAYKACRDLMSIYKLSYNKSLVTDMPLDFLVEMSELKLQLDKVNEAHKIIEMLFSLDKVYHLKVTLSMNFTEYAATAFYHQKFYKIAEKLCQKACRAGLSNTPNGILRIMAMIKAQQGKYAEAEFIYDIIFKTSASFFDMENAAKVKCHLNDWEGADILYTKLIDMYKDNEMLGLSQESWDMALEVKLKKGEIKQAVDLFDQFRNHFGPEIKAEMVIIKKELKHESLNLSKQDELKVSEGT